MSKYSAIFTPKQIGTLPLKHRVVLAPLTRLRTRPHAVPEDFVPEYYSQRTTNGGFLVSEATLIAQEVGSAYYNREPGIWSSEQIEQWKKVTKAVHDKKGFIYSQLWALGRIASPNYSNKVVGPSAGTYNENDVAELTADEIKQYVNFYRQAAINAVEAGFDGVEVHGANGYIIDQFTQHTSNKRTDDYNASGLKFPSEVLDAVVKAVGAEKTGIRLSPFSTFQEMRDESPVSTFVPWIEKIVNTYPKLAYVHFVDGSTPEDIRDGDFLKEIVKKAGIAVISNQNYTLEEANKRAENRDELVAFGKAFIANPDLPERALKELPLNEVNPKTFYSEGEHGYTDYPFYK